MSCEMFAMLLQWMQTIDCDDTRVVLVILLLAVFGAN